MIPQFAAPSFWASLVAIFATAGINSWTSRINQFFFFSRTVPASFAETPLARRITGAYLRGAWLGCASALFIYYGLSASGRLYPLASFCTALLAQCACTCAAFARAHRETGRALGEGAADGLPLQNTPSAVSVPLLDPGVFTPRHMFMLFAAPALALLVSAAALLAAHMSVHQFTDAMDSAKSPFFMGLGLGMMAASVMLYIQLRYFSRHRSAMGRFTANGCVLLAWVGALAFMISTTCVPLHLIMTSRVKAILLGCILAITALRMLYGWSRARLFVPPPIERSGDQFWRWGLFYYNPSDPTLFIQHRSGPGYTVNFANLMAWPLTLFFAANFVFLFFLHSHH
jgi:hypothetical protein